MRFLPTSQEVYGQFADAPRWWRVCIRFRFLLAGIYLIALCVALTWGESAVLSDHAPGENVVFIGLVAALFFGQAMLLGGAPQFHRSRPVRRRRKMGSLVAGAFAAAAITCGICATLVSLSGRTLRDVPAFGAGWSSWIILIGIPWIFWFAVFAVLLAGRWSSGFGWMYRALVAGTFAEVLFTVPVDVMVRRRTSCYCDEGTFWALIIGGTSALWTFGPGVALLFVAVRMQRRIRAGVCVACGYDLRGLPEPRCPECGLAFEPEAGSATRS